MSAASPAASPTKQKPRVVRFKTPDELAAEVDRLHRGGYEKLGNWSLPQICRHLTIAVEGALRPPASTTPTPEQAAMKSGLVDVILKTGKPPDGLQAPDFMIPPPDCSDADVERFKQVLVMVFAYPYSHVDFGPMGPVPADEMRELTLLHAAHHLAFLQPKSARRMIRFASEDDVIADVERLRKGYTKVGSWSLPQMAWHLNQAVLARMKPGPHAADTPEQIARKPLLQHVLSMNGYLPDGITAPDPMVPPADAPESTVDDLIASLKQFKQYKGEIAPHRLFGHIPDAEARRLNLIHCAHHLSYLTPTT